MNLTQIQTQIQTQEIPDSLSDLFEELADLYLDYRSTKPSTIVEDMEILDNYQNFPELVGKCFLSVFGKALEGGI